MARAFGSYPECHWFESDRRYQQKPFKLKNLDGFFICLQAVERRETENHPLCGWGPESYTKNHLSSTIRVFRPIATKKGEVYGKPNP